MRDTAEDQGLPRRRGCGPIFLLIMVVIAAVYGSGLGVFIWLVDDARSTVRALDEYRPRTGSKVYSADGELLGEFSVMQRELVSLSQVPLRLQQAFVATEDDEFYQHKGVRPLALVSVARDYLRTGHLRGASTITQQVVRGVGEWHVDEGAAGAARDPQIKGGDEVQTAGPLGVGKERKVRRKLKEMLISLQVEREFTKDEILEIYLNGIFLGIRANGVQAAAQQYFGKNCWDLTLAESALLAGLTRSPNRQQPFLFPEAAINRRNIVLKQMLDKEFITPDEYEAAIREGLENSLMTPERRALLAEKGQPAGVPGEMKAPYFVEEIRLYIQKEADKRDIFEEGLDIHTTLDLRIQKAAEDVLFKALEEFDAKKLKSLKVAGRESEFVPVSGALVCIDNRPGYKGYVRAMVSRDLQQPKFNCATLAERQPGSSIKPFVWAAAIANGMTPSSIEVDEPFVRIDRWTGTPWAPQNFDPRYLGPVTLRTALQKSINIVSIKLVERLTLPVVRSYLQRAGITTPIKNDVGLTIALGTPEVRVIDLCTAYSTLANMGVRHDPVLVERVNNRDGLVIYDSRDRLKTEQAMPANVAYVMTHLLQGVCKYGTGTGGTLGCQAKWEKAHPGRPRAGKTGTSNQSRNVWFCGFTPEFSCAVWVGYDDNRPLGNGRDYTGGRIANPIWTDFMILAEQGLPVREFEVPEGVVFINVDRDTGRAGGDFKEAFVKGTGPSAARPRQETLETESVDLESFNARLLETL